MRWRSPDGRDAADLAACRTLLAGGSRTFQAASLLLPAAVRDPACALYAFCRVADDAIDLPSGGPGALDALRERLARIYEGRPQPLAVDRAFAGVVERFAIPRVLPEALLEGFAWDLAGRHYDDLGDLEAYAARVAGSVGAMMALVMRTRSPDLVARACDLGIAMQLSNVARDVGEDARAGRLYLPRLWLAEAGIDPAAFVRAPAYGPRLEGVIERLLGAADAIYAGADFAIDRLPAACRPGIRAARTLYAEIGREVRRNGCDSVTRRAVVSSSRKLALVVRVLAPGRAPFAMPVAPACRAGRFLVEAVARVPGPPEPRHGASTAPWAFARRAKATLALFERLERRDRLQSRAAGRA